MANFIATQSISTIGLCQKIVSTDTSDYTGNVEGYDESDVEYKKWTFRDSSGTIIKQEETAANVYSSECAITLLTLFITLEFVVRLKSPINQSFVVQNSYIIPCIGI